MTVVATAADPRFTVSRVDVDRPGPTFTTDTLRDLAAARPGAELFFITGADALEQIVSWKDVDVLWELARFVAVSRPGHTLDVSGLPVGRVSVVEIPALAISSSDIRRRVREGRPIRYLVPTGVLQYIAKSGLYRDEGDPRPLRPGHRAEVEVT